MLLSSLKCDYGCSLAKSHSQKLFMSVYVTHWREGKKRASLFQPLPSVFQRVQLFLNLISLLLVQICYCVLHSSARAGSPVLSRSASVTIATAMDYTVESTWLPKGNCSSQAVCACVASHMSDKRRLDAVIRNLCVSGETLSSRITSVVSCTKTAQIITACEKRPGPT